MGATLEPRAPMKRSYVLSAEQVNTIGRALQAKVDAMGPTYWLASDTMSSVQQILAVADVLGVRIR